MVQEMANPILQQLQSQEEEKESDLDGMQAVPSRRRVGRQLKEILSIDKIELTKWVNS